MEVTRGRKGANAVGETFGSSRSDKGSPMPSSPSTLTRRRFMQVSASALSVPTIVPASVLRGVLGAPSERLTVGIIGLGSRGYNLLDDFLREADAQIVAVCDVDALHYRDNPWGQGLAYGREPGQKRVQQSYARQTGNDGYEPPAAYSDHRELCGHGDLDIVVVATPDHWHALCTLEALRQGRDVYCEKPVTHSFYEGQTIYRAVAEHKAIFQTGCQQRSMPRFRKAVEIVRNGHLGAIQRLEVGLPPGYAEPRGDTAVQDPPEHLDYDLWCGPSEVLPYMRARHHRWWRGHRAYGGGVLMDWIGHHNDIAHWSL
ncbi:MAG TPA: Gfo/Idh/MocA family oxidoreductase, partial [Candidatus Hydrogenedentes bacterium]|nr:Gfo/Idh/MocA family oxidoreductase [Candidatus Hydrogenedentota bacterium]